MKLLDKLRGMLKPDVPADQVLEAACLELLQAYAAAYEDHLAAPAPRQGLWVFAKTFDHEGWARDLAQVIVEREVKIRTDAAQRAAKGAGVSCACRCRAHGRAGCPVCTTIEKCPLHVEPDPASLREP